MTLDPADRMLLLEVRAALAAPFRDPVRVGGVLVPRKLARQIERGFARLKLAPQGIWAPDQVRGGCEAEPAQPGHQRAVA